MKIKTVYSIKHPSTTLPGDRQTERLPAGKGR